MLQCLNCNKPVHATQLYCSIACARIWGHPCRPWSFHTGPEKGKDVWTVATTPTK